MSFPAIIFSDAGSQAHRLNSTVKTARLGQIMWFPDGRRYRYALAGGTTLVGGDILQGKAVVSGDYTDVVTDVAPAVGNTSLSLTTTTTTAANYYDDGWAHCNKATTTLQNQAFKLRKTNANIVFAASAGNIVYLNPSDPISVAGTTASEFGLVPNEFNGVIVYPTTLTSRIVGVASFPIATTRYGYVQTYGMGVVNAIASEVVGNRIIVNGSTAGRAALSTEAAAETFQTAGIVMSVATTAGEGGACFIVIE